MKMVVYSVQPEEKPIFRRFQEQYHADLVLTEHKPNLQNVCLAYGADAINVLSDTIITEALWDAYKEAGIFAAVTRCIGMEHMNREYAERLSIAVFNIEYSPASVADYTIMMMLMVLRHVKPMMQRYIGQDYTVSRLQGRELPNLTVGILGAGRIGCTVAKHLTGFGCNILYWNRRKKWEMDGIATPVELDELFSKSDILSIHLSANAETECFVNRERLAAMKPGAVLINTARGTLVDTDALIDLLESGHLGGAGLDVFGGDRSIYYRDFKNTLVGNRQMAILNAMPNVLMLPHMAYLTDQALEDMVHNSLRVISDFIKMRGQ